MNYETIKVGSITYKIANNSCNLSVSSSSNTAIIIENNTIDNIYNNLKLNNILYKYNNAGILEWQRRDVEFTGKMQVIKNYMVGIDQTQTGVDEEGKPIYDYTNIHADVLIVELQVMGFTSISEKQEKRISELEQTVYDLLQIF